jgi:hypothetical protein
MKAHLFSVATAALLCCPHGFAQDKSGADSASKLQPTSGQSIAEKPKLTPEELETKFKNLLTKATMSGRWCLVKDGKLTPEKDDKYTIQSVSKLGGDMWIIHARIQYNKKDIVAPIPVQVKWAGDTPVIVVDNIPVPGGGTYSARVLFYDKTYAGTWSGGEHVGLLNGVITNEKEESPDSSQKETK